MDDKPRERLSTVRVILEVVVEGNMPHQKLAEELLESIHYTGGGRQAPYYEDDDSKWGIVRDAKLVGFRNEEG